MILSKVLSHDFALSCSMLQEPFYTKFRVFLTVSFRKCLNTHEISSRSSILQPDQSPLPLKSSVTSRLAHILLGWGLSGGGGGGGWGSTIDLVISLFFEILI